MEDGLLWPICQSCARPLIRGEDFGTNGDGTRNRIYCRTCCAGGTFTRPALTMEEMIREVIEQIVAESGMPLLRAEEITRSVIPHLKRWRNTET
jgi:hypothetical protein